MKQPGGLLLVAAGGAALSAHAFVLPPKAPTGPRAFQGKQQPLHVKTGNWFGEGNNGGRAAEKSSGNSAGAPNPFGAAFASAGNPFGELKMALRDALWKADEAIQGAVSGFNETALQDSLVAAFQSKASQLKPKAPEPTKFAAASAPSAPPKPAAAAAAVPPPVTRTPPPPPPPPRMPPTDDEEEKKTAAVAASAAPKPSASVTITEKPAVVIPPPAAVPQVTPKAPVAAAAATTPKPAAAASAPTAAATTPVAPIKSARELVEEKARSMPIASAAAAAKAPFAASASSVPVVEKEDPLVVKARSQRWAEDVVKRARQASVQAASSKAASATGPSAAAREAAAAKAKKRREEEKAAEQSRRARALEARKKLHAERVAALQAKAAAKPTAEEPVLAVKTAMPAEKAAAAVESLAAKTKETVATAAAAAAVVDVKASAAQPTVGALMAAAQKEMDAAVTKAEAVVVPPPPTPAAAAAAVVEEQEEVDRSSVETMLRDSKAAAVEEWHRSRTAEKGVSLDEKVGQLERRLVDEIRAGPGEGIIGCVELLEKIGEAQPPAPAQEAAGRWDLAYSSGPVAPLLALPRWLARFLVGLSATVEASANNSKAAVVYRAVFKFFDWFPRLRRTQRATVQAVSPRKQMEVLSSPPRFTLGRRLSFTLPRFLARLGTAADPEEEAPRLSSSCTYLGSQLKICRLARPASGAEPLVAVYLRGNPALSYEEEDMLALNKTPEPESNKPAGGIRSPAVSKLFQRFNKRKPAPAA